MYKVIRELIKSPILVFIAFISGWELLARFYVRSVILLPSFTSTIKTLFKILLENRVMDSTFTSHFTVTFSELLITFVLVISMGFTLGLSIGLIKFFGDVIEPLMYMFYAIPSVLLLPAFILLFGIYELGKVLFGLFLGLLPMTINTIAGVRQVDRSYIRISKQLGATELQILRDVILPASLPNILIGIRLGVGYGLIGVFVSEMLASGMGLGYLITLSSFLYETETMYSMILLVVIISFAIYYTLRIIEKRGLRYMGM